MKTFTLSGFQVYAFGSEEPKEKALFFAHANGISAQTYSEFLEELSKKWNCEIYTYDMRGFGKTQHSSRTGYRHGKKGIWWVLVEDHVDVFWEIKEYRSEVLNRKSHTQWVFAGHSLGAWLSIKSAGRCHVQEVLLLDMPTLKPLFAFCWRALCLFGFRSLNPLSKRTRHRKRSFPLTSDLLKTFKRSPFFRSWPDDKIKLYIESNFKREKDRSLLCHDPYWEADIFEMTPSSTKKTLLKIKSSIRKNLHVHMVAGEKSELCHAASGGRLFKKIFPQGSWHVLPLGDHMFPYTYEAGTLEFLNQQFPNGSLRPNTDTRGSTL